MAANNMENVIRLVVVTPDRVFFEGDVYSATIPATDGAMGVMAGHEPQVVSITPGIVTIRDDEGIRHFFAAEGYSEIGQSLIMIVCNSAEWPEEISVGRIFESYKIACDTIEEQKKDTSHKYPNDAFYMKQRAIARMHLIESYGPDAKKQRLAELKGE
ncbi:MAG: F0F1 ATP synthase subunit epsilon [Clostridiales bacterium]|nr:F0F1 ATP synthase subunit epsilon [Clostridiales bacterium]